MPARGDRLPAGIIAAELGRRSERRRPLGTALRIAALSLCVASCSSELHHDLDERAANEAVVALALEGVAASKQAEGEGRWTILVPASQEQRALQVLVAAGLPRPAGAPDPEGGGGLVPSPEAERAERALEVARGLERTLLAIQGIVDARVHVVLPDVSRDPFREAREQESPRAAVLLVYRAGADVPNDEAIRAIVLGATEGLIAEQIAIVRSETTVPEAAAAELVAIGPIAVAAESATLLRAVLGALAGLVGLLGALASFVAVRGRRRAA